MSDINNAQNVSVAKPKINGAVFRAPLGTSVPTSASETLNSAFKCMGYISNDGVTNSNSPSTSEIKAWGGDTIANPQTDRPDKYKMKFVEVLNTEVLKAIYGDDNVVGESLDDGIAVAADSSELPECAWVIDSVLRGNVLDRIVIARGKITELADIVRKDDEVIGFDATISTVPGSDGKTHHEYFKKGPTGATGATA